MSDQVMVTRGPGPEPHPEDHGKAVEKAAGRFAEMWRHIGQLWSDSVVESLPRWPGLSWGVGEDGRLAMRNSWGESRGVGGG